MPHFFLAPDAVQGDEVTIVGPLARHLFGALRHRERDRITVVGTDRIRRRIQIIEANSTRVRGRILEILPEHDSGRCHVTLAQALLKSDHMDIVVRSATELGVRRIIPIVTHRTIIRPRQDRSSRQLDRWRSIAREAAQQSERTSIPEIADWTDFGAWCSSGQTSPQLRMLLGEREYRRSLREELETRLPCPELTLGVGPEGGFAPEEVTHAEASGFAIVSLGRAILRSETASMAALTIVQYATGNLGGPTPTRELSHG